MPLKKWDELTVGGKGCWVTLIGIPMFIFVGILFTFLFESDPNDPELRRELQSVLNDNNELINLLTENSWTSLGALGVTSKAATIYSKYYFYPNYMLQKESGKYGGKDYTEKTVFNGTWRLSNKIVYIKYNNNLPPETLRFSLLPNEAAIVLYTKYGDYLLD